MTSRTRNLPVGKLIVLLACILGACVVLLSSDGTSENSTLSEEPEVITRLVIPANRSERAYMCYEPLAKRGVEYDYANYSKETIMWLSAYDTLDIEVIGEWKEGVKYNESCILEGRDYQSGCCGDRVRQMHFEFNDEAIESINNEKTLDMFVEKMKGKNVILFGDSLQRNFFSGLTELFQLGKQESRVLSVRSLKALLHMRNRNFSLASNVL